QRSGVDAVADRGGAIGHGHVSAPVWTVVTVEQETRSTPAGAWSGRGEAVEIEPGARWSARRRSADRLAVHLAERIADELDPLAVRAPQVERGAAHVVVVDPGLVELGLEVGPPLGLDRDRQVLEPAEHLGV